MMGVAGPVESVQRVSSALWVTVLRAVEGWYYLALMKVLVVIKVR